MLYSNVTNKRPINEMLLNFHKIAGDKRAHMYPVMSQLVDDELLERMGAKANGGSK